jgi:hypothetical protein
MFPPSLISLYECDSQRGKMRAIDTIETNEQKITAHVQANFQEVSRVMKGETAMPFR